MTSGHGAEKREFSPARPMAHRLVASALRAASGGDWMVEDRADLDAIPSGSARLAVMQTVAVAAMAVDALAQAQGRDPGDVLEELWPHEKRWRSRLERIDRSGGDRRIRPTLALMLRAAADEIEGDS